MSVPRNRLSVLLGVPLTLRESTVFIKHRQGFVNAFGIAGFACFLHRASHLLEKNKKKNTQTQKSDIARDLQIGYNRGKNLNVQIHKEPHMGENPERNFLL